MLVGAFANDAKLIADVQDQTKAEFQAEADKSVGLKNSTCRFLSKELFALWTTAAVVYLSH